MKRLLTAATVLVGLSVSQAQAITFLPETATFNLFFTGFLFVETGPISGTATGTLTATQTGATTWNVTGATGQFCNPIVCDTFIGVRPLSTPTSTDPNLDNAPYDNVLYYPPDLLGLFFDNNGLDLVGNYSDYRFYSNLADPLQTNIGTFEGDAVVTRIDAVPGPIVGAGLPGLVMAFGGFLAWRRRRAAPVAA